MSFQPCVFFLHGLESGPNGRKATIMMNAGYPVLATQMPCSFMNSFFGDIGLIAFLTTSVIFATYLFLFKSLLISLLFLAAEVVAFFFLKFLVVRRVFRRSVQCQIDYLESVKQNGRVPDIAVGSSFGGAVLVELIERGIWKGKAILLAPACHKIAKLAKLKAPTLQKNKNILIVHGTKDKTVPLEDSKKLNNRIIEVNDNHRLSKTFTPENFKTWIEELEKTE